MTTSRKLAVALTGAVALASGAYAMGSQAGDGSAVADPSAPTTAVGYGSGPAAGGPSSPGRHEGRGLADLASRLGVSEERLRAALDELRADRPDHADRHERVAAALATALGLSQEKVLAALDGLRPHRDRVGRPDERLRAFAAGLARALGLDAAEVRAALDKLRGDRPGNREERLSALAKQLGVSEARLRDALRRLRPAGDHPRGPGVRDRAAGVRALAGALGVVDAAKVRAALDDVAATLRKEGEARRAAFAEQLAQKLGIPVERVRAALPDGPWRGNGPHHP